MSERLLLLLGTLLTALTVQAQSYSMRVLGNPVINVTNTNDYRNGVTVLHNTLQASVSANYTYTLQVRAAGDMRSGIRTIPASQMRLRIANVPGATDGVNLSTRYQTLISARTTSSLSNLTVTLEYKLAGGQPLLQPGGAYTTTLTFLLTAQ